MFAGARDYLPSADKWLLHIHFFVCKHLTRAICNVKTTSLAQILCTQIVSAFKVHYTLIMNNMRVAFVFRPLTFMLYTLV